MSAAAWLAVVAAQDVAPVRHIGISKSESIQLCAGQAFGHPVVLSHTAPMLDREIPCSTPPQEVADLLRRSEGAIAVFQSDEWIYVTPLGAAVGPNRYIEWSRFEIKPVLGNLRATAMTTALTDAELQQLWRLVRSSVRMVPVTFGFLGPATVGEMRLYASLFKLSGTLEVVVGVLDGGPGRLIVGRRSRDGFTITWDSPLLSTDHYWSLEFEDVDGDSVPEILMRSSCCGLRPSGEALSIFSVDGDELTRQTDCVLNGIRVDEESSAACPVVGENLGLQPGPDSTKIIVGNALGRDDGGDRPVRYFRYVLKGRRFVPS